MKICWSCLRKEGLKIWAPQMLVVNIGCGKCEDPKVKSYVLNEVMKQNIEGWYEKL